MNTIESLLTAGGTALPMLVVKATLVLAIVWVATLMPRNVSAAVRHLVWVVGMGGLVLLPVLTWTAPIHIPIRGTAPSVSESSRAYRAGVPAEAALEAQAPVVAPRQGEPVASSVAPARRAARPAAPSSPRAPVEAPRSTGLARWAVGLLTNVPRDSVALTAAAWAIVALGLAGWMVAGMMTVRRIVADGARVTSSEWVTALNEVADRLDLMEVPELVMSECVEMAFVCNLFRPTVVLPVSAEGWSMQLRRAVLLHELGHVRRRDLATQAMSRVACAVYWFHPLVWRAAREMRVEAERACDDIVLGCGTRASEYAQQLLALVTSVRNGGIPTMVLPMARPKELEGRMLAILSETVRRSGVGRGRTLGVVGPLALIVASIAAVAPTRQRSVEIKAGSAAEVAVPETAWTPSAAGGSPVAEVATQAGWQPTDQSGRPQPASSVGETTAIPTLRDRMLGAPTAIAPQAFRQITGVRELSDGRLIVIQTGPSGVILRGLINQIGVVRRAPGGDSGGVTDSTPRSGRFANAAAIRTEIMDSGMTEAASTAQIAGPARNADLALLFDAGLRTAVPVGPFSVAARGHQNPVALMSALGDTTFIAPLVGADVLVVNPKGVVVGSRSLGPNVTGAAELIGGGGGLDARGHLVFQAAPNPVMRPRGDSMHVDAPDSEAIMALDLMSGSTTPLAYVRTAGRSGATAGSGAGGGAGMRMREAAFSIVDDWVMMADGTLAILRGSDLHIDWIAPNGARHSTPPLPHVTMPVTAADKASYLTERHAEAGDRDSFPAFKPPFTGHVLKAASDGTLWLPAKVLSPSGPDGYVVVGRDGKLVERVHLLSGEKLLGFGRGVVYVSVRDTGWVVRLGRVSLH